MSVPELLWLIKRLIGDDLPWHAREVARLAVKAGYKDQRVHWYANLSDKVLTSGPMHLWQLFTEEHFPEVA